MPKLYTLHRADGLSFFYTYERFRFESTGKLTFVTFDSNSLEGHRGLFGSMLEKGELLDKGCYFKEFRFEDSFDPKKYQLVMNGIGSILFNAAYSPHITVYYVEKKNFFERLRDKLIQYF